jgi:C4-dicarboxylate transporter, DctM subunit
MMAVAILGALALLALGTPIFVVLILFGAYGALQTAQNGFDTEYLLQIIDVFKLGTGEPATVLSTIPLFIFIGFVMAEARTAERMVAFAQSLLGWLPGGLAICTIFACAVFTTFTGASGATIVALGALVMPSLLKQKYPERFSLGLVTGTGSIGLLFFPAVPLFVYGTVYGLAAQTSGDTGVGEMALSEFSTGRFVLSGIVPGIVLIAIMSAFAMAVALKNKVPRQPFDGGKLLTSFVRALPEMGMIAVMALVLALGAGIPEAAAASALYILLVEVAFFRDVPVKKLWTIVGNSMALVGAIFIIILAAQAFTNYLITAEVPKALFGWMTETFQSKWTFLLGLNILLIFVGMLMDIFSAIIVVVPLITPVARHYGIDPYHLGIIFLLNLEIGYITPPVGLNLYISAFAFKKPVMEVTRAAIPFLICMIVALGVITYIPAITTTFVPPAERRGRVVELASRVRTAIDELGTVKELALPDGKVMKLAECDAIEDPLSKQGCTSLFLGVTACRKEAGGQVGSPCETSLIQEYLDDKAEDEDDDWSSDGGEADAKEDDADE